MASLLCRANEWPTCRCNHATYLAAFRGTYQAVLSPVVHYTGLCYSTSNTVLPPVSIAVALARSCSKESSTRACVAKRLNKVRKHGPQNCTSLNHHSDATVRDKIKRISPKCFRMLGCSSDADVTYSFKIKKVKVAHTRLPSVWFRSRSRFLAVSLQVT